MNGSPNTHWAKRRKKWRQSWDKLVFNTVLSGETVDGHNDVLAAAEAGLAHWQQHENDAACLNSNDPVVRQGWALKKEVERQFRDLYVGRSSERILIHVPPPGLSPAGYSLFTNLAESLRFIGVSTETLDWHADTQKVLAEFRPSVFLSSDHFTYLERIDWAAVHAYKQTQRLRVGLTASIAAYENTPLPGRLDWARHHGVDFYYTFRDEAYVTTRSDYRLFFDAAYRMVYIPFGANILHYYPVAGFERDLDFAIMATRKSEHMSYMRDIVRRHRGFIDGPGWKHVRHFQFNRERDRYIYARAKVGLNVHLPEQIEWACEVNERTYQLAACGVPQLIDRVKLLDKLFSRDALTIADSPHVYAHLFESLLLHPEEATQKALLAQREVFAIHTTFHRADSLMRQLASL